MFIVFHVIIALLSMLCTGYTYFFPSKRKLYASSILVALTIITGTYLILSRPDHMVQSCVEGLVYLGIVSIGLVAGHYRLVKRNAS